MNTNAEVTITERALWTPKADHTAEEYEDAAFVSDFEAWPVRAALADGATESAFARDWANNLVHGFTKTGPSDANAFAEHLSDWQATFQDLLLSRKHKERAWYAEQKAEEGAFATLMGLTLDSDRSWQALAVGDCCLFHLRQEETSSWPFEDAAAFDDHPALVPSQPEREPPAIRRREGDWQPGDAFVLATDALAAWLLTEKAPAALLSLNPDQFQETVDAARRDGTLHNDDTTALILEVNEQS